MNKKDLIKITSKENNITYSQSEQILNSILENISKELCNMENVTLKGYFTFKPYNRKGDTIVNNVGVKLSILTQLKERLRGVQDD